jgi:hypothetical protein
MAEIGGAVRGGLLAIAVAAGLWVVGAVMEESVVALAGPKGGHQPDRVAVRHGTDAGSVTLGGRRVAVRRPRLGAVDGSGELPVTAYGVFSGTDLLEEIALGKMMEAPHPPLPRRARTRRCCGRSVGAVDVALGGGSPVRGPHRGRPGELMAADPSDFDVVALMIDGVHVVGRLCVVALGIGIDGTKHPLGVSRTTRRPPPWSRTSWPA